MQCTEIQCTLTIERRSHNWTPFSQLNAVLTIERCSHNSTPFSQLNAVLAIERRSHNWTPFCPDTDSGKDDVWCCLEPDFAPQHTKTVLQRSPPVGGIKMAGISHVFAPVMSSSMQQNSIWQFLYRCLGFADGTYNDVWCGLKPDLAPLQLEMMLQSHPLIRSIKTACISHVFAPVMSSNVQKNSIW